ncbi:MAG: hypothetical protein RLN88_03285 [Ekhidna sp.]|uniref:hypothetical protein n=1 Tax=Ekhidna sp. TaxID=2608089 RepID=UPI0032EF9A1A
MKTSVVSGLVGLLLITSCAKDDSNSNTLQEQIEEVLHDKTFVITSFIDSGNDETSHFNCYAFEFKSDGTVTATNDDETYNGTWSISNDASDDNSESDLDFNLHFSVTNAFEDLNDDWDIVNYNETSIELTDVSGGNGGTDLLTFEIGNPSTNCTSQIQSTIQANVQSGTWRIKKFVDSDTDETIHFANYNFTFMSSGVLRATNGTNDYEGTWSITDSNSNDDSQDDLDFNIHFNLTNDFEDLNDDWDFISQSASEIELTDISGGSGETDLLTFEKN